RVPSMSICAMLGVPYEDAWRFEKPLAVLTGGGGTSVEHKRAALDEFYAYVRDVIARKQEQPDGALISALLERDELTEDELAGVAWFLFAAGHETTAAAFTNSMFFLLYEPGRWQAMQAYPIEAVVEELFRYLPSR